MQAATGITHASGTLTLANGTNNRANGKEEKDVYFRVAQAFGLHRAGFLLYYSPNLLRHGPDDAGLRLGPDVSFYWRRAGLRAQLLANYDDNPTGTDDDFWSIGSFVSPRVRVPGDPFVASAYSMLGGGAVLLVMAVLAGELGELDGSALEPGPLAAWAYLAVAGSVVGFSAYAWLLGNAPISQVVTHQYVNPLVAVVLGALILDERPGPETLAGAALIVGAVMVTASREGRETPVAEPTSRPASAARRETRADPTG